MMRILCQATVDPPLNGSDGWRITVWEMPDYVQTRNYTIAAPNEADAAQEGLRRFVAELEQERGGITDPRSIEGDSTKQ